MPRLADPQMRTRLVEATARRLADHGRDGLSVRSLAADVGASTQVVYTHFDGLDELVAEVWREGFRRFALALDEPTQSDDVVADFVVQGWSYRHFALTDPHLYRVMFGEGLVELREGRPEDIEAASGTFGQLLLRIERCVAAGRWQVDDVFTAGEVIWGVVHGLALIELTGYYAWTERSPTVTYEEALRRVSLGFRDRPEDVEASLKAGWRRAKRAGLV